MEAGKAGSHQRKGWETFTDAVIRAVSEEREHVVFMLWGRYAQEKGAVIDEQRHLALKADIPRPCPLITAFLVANISARRMSIWSGMGGSR